MAAITPETDSGKAKASTGVNNASAKLALGQPAIAQPATAPVASSATVDEEAVTLEAPKSTLEKWNYPRGNIPRFLSTLFSFIVMGMSDGAVGALLPYIESYYDVSYTVISVVFLVPVASYIVASLLNNLIHYHLGRRGIAIIAPFSKVIAYGVACSHPPFPVLSAIMIFTGLGNGLEDSAWNAWVGNLQNANELLGFLHAAYGLGATLSPLIATTMVTQPSPPLPWYTFYYLMASLAAVEAAVSSAAFWTASAAEFRATLRSSANNSNRVTTRQALKEPVTWLVALFLLGYVGSEVSLGGWMTTFMLRVRNAEPFAAGMTLTGFWLGLTVGRVVLGFITGRIGEKLAITIYTILSIALLLMYWLIPVFIASAIFAGFLGFFLGPLFPSAIVVATKVLPSDYHVSAIGFAAAVGGGGAVVFPFVVGAIAQAKGVGVLQPIVLALLIAILVAWLWLPGGMRKGGLERAQENSEKVGYQLHRALKWATSKFK